MNKEIAKTAPDALRKLWREGFFREARSQEETEKKLHGEGYNFGGALRKALERAEYLQPQGKRGEKKFIQRHPYVRGEEDGASN